MENTFKLKTLPITKCLQNTHDFEVTTKFNCGNSPFEYFCNELTFCQFG